MFVSQCKLDHINVLEPFVMVITKVTLTLQFWRYMAGGMCVVGGGACVAGRRAWWGRGAWQERRPLQRTERILL